MLTIERREIDHGGVENNSQGKHVHLNTKRHGPNHTRAESQLMKIDNQMRKIRVGMC